MSFVSFPNHERFPCSCHPNLISTQTFDLFQDDVIACESPPPLDELSNATIPVLFATPTDNSCGVAGGRRISHFKPLYVSVDEERFSAAPSAVGGGLTEHERQLLLDYKVQKS